MNPETNEFEQVEEKKPISDEDMKKLKEMSFEDRKAWLNQKVFEKCKTTDSKEIEGQFASILCYPNKLLREITEDVTDFSQETQNYIEVMTKAMYVHKGMGLAANQIGLLKRIFIIDCAAGSEKSKSDLRVFINPVITGKSKEKVKNSEGCLSFPDVFYPVERYKYIKGTALDREGKEFSFEYDNNVYSIAIQHELDHLNGIVMLDYYSRLTKRYALKTMNKRHKKDLQRLAAMGGKINESKNK